MNNVKTSEKVRINHKNTKINVDHEPCVTICYSLMTCKVICATYARFKNYTSVAHPWQVRLTHVERRGKPQFAQDVPFSCAWTTSNKTHSSQPTKNFEQLKTKFIHLKKARNTNYISWITKMTHLSRKFIKCTSWLCDTSFKPGVSDSRFWGPASC